MKVKSKKLKLTVSQFTHSVICINVLFQIRNEPTDIQFHFHIMITISTKLLNLDIFFVFTKVCNMFRHASISESTYIHSCIEQNKTHSVAFVTMKERTKACTL